MQLMGLCLTLDYGVGGYALFVCLLHVASSCPLLLIFLRCCRYHCSWWGFGM